MVGQDAIVRTLINQISSGHIAHAYLFCGSRGTGKTSTAKIFALAINCLSLTEHGPCRECDACISLSGENNMDVIEIDAASNNGVDEIRDLRDKVRFLPTVGKYKVYIIDEVHMLSIGAFNALLKTLEEPPSHVVFILATTEPHKLPATILSRCQRFDFRRIPHNVIVSRMQEICDRMNVIIEKEGLHTIARWAEGGMRDALSLLDQCMSFCGDHITNDDILFILGTADQSFLFSIVNDIIADNLQGLLHKIGQLMDDGKDLNAFTRDLLQHMRNLLIVKASDEPESLLDVSDSTMEQLKEQAERIGEARLIRAIELLSPLDSEMRRSTQPRILLELTVVKLCRPEQEIALSALMDRVEALEKRLSSQSSAVIHKAPAGDYQEDMQPDDPPDEPPWDYSPEYINPAGREEEAYSQEAHNDDEPVSGKTEKIQGSEKQPESAADPVSMWQDILDVIEKERRSIHVAMAGVRPRMGNNILTLIFPPASGFQILLVEQEGNRRFIEEVVKKITGTEVRVKCIAEDQLEEEAENQTDPDKENHAVRRAIEVFGEDLVEVIDDE